MWDVTKMARHVRLSVGMVVLRVEVDSIVKWTSLIDIVPFVVEVIFVLPYMFHV